MRLNLQMFGGRGASSGTASSSSNAPGAVGLNSRLDDLYANSPKMDVANKIQDIVDDMKVGDSITLLDRYRNRVREFVKRSNVNTTTQFVDIKDNNVLVSGSQVKAFASESVMGNHKPKFKEG